MKNLHLCSTHIVWCTPFHFAKLERIFDRFNSNFVRLCLTLSGICAQILSLDKFGFFKFGEILCEDI
ncbi:hypothetical protein CCZ01_07070 [Helicobacter monodelphidis]|nr:hypothetical protein CCZ01_07070 [Helicobacter sp. 15-1451]